MRQSVMLLQAMPKSQSCSLLAACDWQRRSKEVVRNDTFFHNIFVKDCLLPWVQKDRLQSKEVSDLLETTVALAMEAYVYSVGCSWYGIPIKVLEVSSSL